MIKARKGKTFERDYMDNREMQLLKKWLIAVRPFALPASTMPVLFGTILAAVIGEAHLNWLRFIFALFAMVLLHSGANMLNDVIDFKMKIDRDPTPFSGALVRGLLKPKAVLIASFSLLFTGSAIGLFLVWITGMALLIVGIIGVFVGVFYTAGPFALKYHALGDLAIFLNFGVLGSLGAWLVQTGSFSWLPVVWTIPMSLIVVGILHANNWRDIPSDSKAGIFTIASILGDRNSLVYFTILIFSPFLLTLALVLIPRVWLISFRAMPFTFLVTIFSLPFAISLWKRAFHRMEPGGKADFAALDGSTAQMNLLFGLLCCGALILHYFVKSSI